METKAYLHILRNKVLFNWLPVVRPLAYLPYRINEQPVIVLGNQKAGTSAIAALLARATGRSYDIDIGGFRNREYAALHAGTRSLRALIEARARIEFSKGVVKEPNLTFLADQLVAAFPEARFVFIVRDPRANIRSTLNRLQVPGNLPRINPQDYPQLSPIWRSILYNEWVSDASEPLHYIGRSATRWRVAAQHYFDHEDRMALIRYEDFNRDKQAAIERLAQRLDLPVTHDISDRVDIRFQPKGNNRSTFVDFFGPENLALIERTCTPLMQKFDYQPESLATR